MELSPKEALFCDLINISMAIGTGIFIILELSYIGFGATISGICSIWMGLYIAYKHLGTYGDHWRNLIRSR